MENLQKEDSAERKAAGRDAGQNAGKKTGKKEEELALAEGNKKENRKEGSSSHIQVYEIITSKDPSWQGIIYELINSEQLDPWDIDIALLCQRYFDKIHEMEEHNFFVSSKILLAASLLLRIKSEILLNKNIREIDEVLFGKKEEKEEKLFERIEIDQDELPLLLPKSPLPRFKKVTLSELMSALDTAIKTESRRINREIEKKHRERLAQIDIPKARRVNIKDMIRHLYAKILSSFKHPEHKSKIKLPFSHFTGSNKEEKLFCFLPLLHLSNTGKLWLEQARHFDEIWVYMYQTFKDKFPEHDADLREIQDELQKEIKEISKEIEEDRERKRETEKAGQIQLNKLAENPVGDLISEETENEE